MSKVNGKGLLKITSAGTQTSVGQAALGSVQIQSLQSLGNLSKNQVLGLGANGSMNWQNIFTTDTFIESEYVKKKEVYMMKEDVIALATTLDRLRRQDPTTYYRLTDSKLFQQITESDRFFAKNIRDYYNKKAIVWKLKNNQVSNFRNDLIDLINSDGKNVTENYFGMAYHLPNFYRYDTEMDQLKEELGLPINADKYKSDGKTVRLIKVAPMKMIERKSKSTHKLNYWFKVNDEIGGCITLQPNNELLSMFNHFFYNHKSMTMEARTYPLDLDNHKYLKLIDYKIVG